MKKTVISIVLLFILGCGDSATDSSEKIMAVDFKLTDGHGIEKSTFLLGQDILFEFSIANHTGANQAWSAAYDWPAARFTVQQGSDFLGSTYESMPPTKDIAGVLAKGDTLWSKAAWSDHSCHAPLAVGSYTAYALVNYEMEHLPQPFQPWAVGFTVEPAILGSTEIFAWYRRPMFGFCVPVNWIFHASVVRSADSLYSMSGTTLLDNSLLTMPCIDVGWTDNCFMQIPFGTIYVRPEHAAALEQLLADFPVEEHELDPACDPCLINRYYVQGRIEDINPCASGTEQYWQTVAGIDTLVHQILYASPDCTVVLSGEGSLNSR